MKDFLQIWNKAAERFREERPREYRVWLSGLRPIRVEGSCVVVGTPNKFFWEWFSNNYLPLFSAALEEAWGKKPSFKVEVVEAARKERNNQAEGQPANCTAKPPARLHPRLNPVYTFDRFVPGKSNEMAYRAALDIAGGATARFNPLFVHGGTGLGKTHLLHAIGHNIYDAKGERGFTYVTSEQFLNEFVASTKSQRMNEFRDRYRKNCQMLLVDDIQFIAGNKEMTQEEFFHTFNSLHDEKKQIIITSDRFPQEIPGLEDRLRSRFSSGLIVEIKPPNLEERLSILKRKAAEASVALPGDVAEFIAENCRSNVREIEGALNQITALASLTGSEISLDVVQETMKNIVKQHGEPVTVDEIIRVTCNFFGVKPQDVKSHRRQREITVPRQVAMYLCRKLLKMSYPDIGSRFGGKDHSTVISSIKKVEGLLQRDPEFRKKVDSIDTRLVSR